MALFSTQVTIPTGGGPVQLSTAQTSVRYIEFQNNATASMRVGAANINTTTGHNLSASGGAWTISNLGQGGYFAYLSDWYAVGTAGQILDVQYVT